MQLRPREIFTIARGLEDHTDSGTYYVRAVIRNARTDEIIQVSGNNYINLADQGDGHRFTADWQVPADPSGEGFYILIITSVYTDANYTTKSDTYGDKLTEYLVQDRLNANTAGMGGGADIDYKKVRQIIREELEKMGKPQMPDLAPILTAIGSISFPDINIPEQKEIDLGPILNGLERVEKSIPTAILKGLPKVDFGPLEEELRRQGKSNEEIKEVVKFECEKVKEYYEKIELDTTKFTKMMDEMYEKVKFLCLDDMTDMRKNVGTIKTHLSDMKQIIEALQETMENNDT